jgi:hypothetical protein
MKKNNQTAPENMAGSNTFKCFFWSGCSTTKPAWYLSQYLGDQPDTIVVVSLSDNYRQMFGFPHLCKFTAEHYIDSFP